MSEINRNHAYHYALKQLILESKEKNGWSYPWLSKALSEQGFTISAAELQRKVSTGVMASQVFLAICLVCKISVSASKISKLIREA